MPIKKLTLSIVALSFICGTYAQDRLPLSFSSQSVYFNPSMTGPATNNFQSLLYGYEDSGEDQKFTTNALLNYDHFFEKINSTLGVNLSYNDKPPRFGRTSDNYEIGLLYNYRFQIKDSLSIRIGIRASYMSSDTRFAYPGEFHYFYYTERYIPINQSNNQFNLDAGVSIYWKRFFLGTAVKRITEPVMEEQITEQGYLFYPLVYYLSAGGTFTLSENLQLESAALLGVESDVYNKNYYHNYYSLNLNSIIHKRIVLGLNASDRRGNLMSGVLTGYKFNKFSRMFVLTKSRDMLSFGMEIGANVGF